MQALKAFTTIARQRGSGNFIVVRFDLPLVQLHRYVLKFSLFCCVCV
jgi:hypothetical protein